MRLEVFILAKERRIRPTIEKFYLNSGIFTICLSILMIFFNISEGHSLLVWVYFIFLLSAIFTISTLYIKGVDSFSSVALLLVLCAVVGSLYFYQPDALIALASIVGVASFLYLIIEKVIESNISR